MRKIMWLLFPLMLIISICTCMAELDRWEPIKFGNNPSRYYFDKHTIKYVYVKEIEQVCIDFWLKTNYTPEQATQTVATYKKLNISNAEDYSSLAYTLNRILFSNNRQLCYCNTYSFTKSGGMIGSSSPKEKLNWLDIIPGTNDEDIYNAVAKYANAHKGKLKNRMSEF